MDWERIMKRQMGAGKKVHAMPVITAIVPTFNHQDFVERCLCSVIDQALKQIQIIVVDRGSCDQTRKIINYYKSEVAQMIDAPGTSLGAAINRGLLHATGRYITVLRGDYLLMPGAIQTVCDHLQKHPQTHWLASTNLRIDANDQLKGNVNPVLPQHLADYLKHNTGLIPPAGVFWRKALIDEVGLFDDDLEEAYDYDFYCRLLRAGHTPAILGQMLAAVREYIITDPMAALDTAEQYIHVARKYAAKLPMTQRYGLWNNCDLRQRIVTLARSEMQGKHTQSYLAWKLFTHPWWVSDHHLWEALFKEHQQSHNDIQNKDAA